jgi:hypothetical protein
MKDIIVRLWIKSKWVDDNMGGHYEISVRKYMWPIIFVLILIEVLNGKGGPRGGHPIGICRSFNPLLSMG